MMNRQKVGTIGMVFKKYRKKKKLRQSDLAQSAGLATSTYQRYERGEQLPPVNAVIEIAQLLNIPANQILSAYNVIPEDRFPKSYSREYAQNQIEAALSESESDIEGREVLKKTISAARISEQEVFERSIKTYLYGWDESVQSRMMAFFAGEISARRLIGDTFARLAGSDDGIRTKENVELVKIAKKLSCGASAFETKEWVDPYDRSLLSRSASDLIAWSDQLNQRVLDAAELNKLIGQYGGELSENSEERQAPFDWTHFLLSDQLVDNFQLKRIFEKLVDDLQNGVSISKAVDFEVVYSAIISSWDFIYDRRDTFRILLELQRMQPEESYPTMTPDLMNEIRLAFRDAGNSWQK